MHGLCLTALKLAALGHLALASGPGATHFQITKLWTKRFGGQLKIEDDPWDGRVQTNQGFLHLETGELGHKARSDPAYLSFGDLPRQTSGRQDGRPLSVQFAEKQVFWNFNGWRLASKLHGKTCIDELAPNGFVTRQYRVPKRLGDAQFFSGNTRDGLVCLAGMSIYMSHEAVWHYLLLRPLRRSPLPFFLFYDIRKPTQGVLGVPFSPRKSLEQVESMQYTPTSPLSCGDPVTGKVSWTRAKFGYGQWLGDHAILAQDVQSNAWKVLDPSGNDTGTNLSTVCGTRQSSWVKVAGDYILIQDNYSYTCYRLSSIR